MNEKNLPEPGFEPESPTLHELRVTDYATNSSRDLIFSFYRIPFSNISFFYYIFTVGFLNARKSEINKIKKSTFFQMGPSEAISAQDVHLIKF